MLFEFFRHPVEWASLGISPVALELGPLVLRWYSLAYITGILYAWLMLGRMVQRRSQPPISTANLDDLISWITLGIIGGGRLGYVLFYDFAKFAADPLAILRLWEGGMSFHGGFAGVIVAITVYCHRRGIAWLRVLDYAAVVTPVGLLLGRMANFVNGELWGRPTDGTWGLIFAGAGDGVPRHPSTLYAAASEGALLLLVMSVLFWATRARLRPGLLGGIFIGLYGVLRFGLEHFRQPDEQIGILPWGLSMGQTLCVPMIVAGAWLVWRAQRRPALPDTPPA
jgi:phosphatidylglycerol---prolipoprotein diacylglyceryl transferase